MSLEAARKITETVDGWLGRREGLYLYRLARATAGLGVVVEIGSYKGKSTVWLAKAREAARGEEVCAVDPHVMGTIDEFRRNLELSGVAHMVVPVVRPSEEALRGWNRPIGLLWIDGDHSHAGVRKDFFGWEPLVSPGGVIAFHDSYSWEGVRSPIDEELIRDERFQILGQWDGIFAIRKTPGRRFPDRVRRRVFIRLRALFNRGRAERRHWRALPRRVLRHLSGPRDGE
ncbi:MAG TPA: class I SAM-dependent methyltransferase [candidate division Zixibacteria bacterium]|nr:class I SAM-dependent methyltransferase [candidate division Zixibacteria bacterium]